MIQQTDYISRNAELCRQFGTLAVSGCDELMGRQLDMSEQLFMRNSQKLQGLLSKSSSLSSPEGWLQAMQNTAQCMVEMTHEFIATLTAQDVEIRRLMYKYAADMQQFYSDSMKELDIVSDEKLSSDKRPGRKLAA